jgi:hypothetical protein
MPGEVANVVISAVAGLITGAVASLVAPWVNWRIERVREQLRYRREVVSRIREVIGSAAFEPKDFFRTIDYQHVRRLIPERSRTSMESDRTVIATTGGDWRTPYRQALAEAVAALERQWQLV